MNCLNVQWRLYYRHLFWSVLKTKLRLFPQEQKGSRFQIKPLVSKPTLSLFSHFFNHIQADRPGILGENSKIYTTIKQKIYISWIDSALNYFSVLNFYIQVSWFARMFPISKLPTRMNWIFMTLIPFSLFSIFINIDYQHIPTYQYPINIGFAHASK